jgi:hypothetical protein|tara:strand:- start:124 stop:261 length:138 start_codon:yes stop_codon:yes gene_type:complete
MKSGKEGIYIHSDLYIALKRNSVSQHTEEVNLFVADENKEALTHP